MSDVKNVSLFTKMPPRIFNVGLFLGRRYWGDVKGLFCVSDLCPKMFWKKIVGVHSSNLVGELKSGT